MKRIVSIFTALTGICMMDMSCSHKTAMHRSPLNEKNPVIAHRGAFKKNGFPENSLASLKEAFRLGCAGSEFDVRMTADDSLVINHDPNYNKLQIEKANYAALVTQPLSNGEKLPTLREYLLAGKAAGKGTRLIVEIKPSDISKSRAQIVTDKVVKLVEELDLKKQVAYISFDYDVCKRIHVLDAAAHCQYLNGDKSPDELKADGINGLDYHFSVFQKNPTWAASAKKNGLVLNAWTVNDATTMRSLLNQGFEFITTNEPEMLFEEMKKK